MFVESRKNLTQLLGLAVLLISLAFVAAAPAATPARDQIRKAKVSQAGKSLIVQVRTARQVALRKLHRFPLVERRKAKYLCTDFQRAGRKVVSRLCLGGRRAHHIVSISRVRPNGKVASKRTIRATVKRSGKRKLVFKIDPKVAHLVPAAYSWRSIYSDGHCPARAKDCGSRLPSKGRFHYRVLPVAPVGCVSGGHKLYTHGRQGRKRVALTFDDGPSLYTNDVLRILRRKKVTATFFELGSEVARYPDQSRAVLAAGHEIGNHSTNHVQHPGARDLAHTSHVIKAATGFKPCDFRPPYGAVNSSVIAGAGASGMSTINWDVDTVDWSLPGSSTITSRVLGGVRPGSIVLMHDGGGPRGGTVASLPATIHGLRKRGYKFVTVSQILGGHFKYRPVR